jgi:hypothetical protein
MQLMRLADVPLSSRDRVFHYSKLRAAVGALLLGGIAIAALIFAKGKDVWLAYYVAAVILIYLIILQRLITARFRPSNWLVRANDDGLFIKFRSYLNDRFPADDCTVVFLPYSETRSAKLIKERQELPDRDARNLRASTLRTRRFVQLELAGDGESLAKALANESKRVFAKPFDGGANVSTRYQHVPVKLSDRILRIEWAVVPSAQVLLDVLTRHTLVQPAGTSIKDFAHLEGLDRKEQESRLLELAESGDMIGAVTLARQLYAYDLTTAKDFVDSLIRQSRAL